MMIDSGLFMVSDVVVNYTEIDVREELTRHISDLFMPVVKIDSILIKFWGISLSKFHIVDSDTVIR